MKAAFDPLIICGDGFSQLNDWFRCATPDLCYELIKGIVEGDPDRQLVLEDPYGNTAHWDIACGSYTPFCSNCGDEPPAYEMTEYCPHCGAKMVTRRKGVTS